MKKLFSILLLLCLVTAAKAQYPLTQNLASDSSLVRIGATYNGAIKGGLINMSFTDTTAANLSRISFYAGAQIFTTSDTSLWIRNKTATNQFWAKIGGTGGGATGSFWNLTGNFMAAIPAGFGIGTNSTDNLPFKTDGTTRVILPSTGLARQSGGAWTTMMFDTTNKTWGYGNGYIPTLQQVITAGPNITSNWTSDFGNTSDLNFLNMENLFFTADNNNSSTVNQYMRTANQAPYAVTFNNATSYESGIILSQNSTSNTDTLQQISIYSTSSIPDFTYAQFPGSTGIRVRPNELLLKLRNANNANLKIVNLPTTTDTTNWKPLAYRASDSTVKYLTSWPGGGSSSVALSSITAATASNTINNGDYKQRWQWNTLSGANGLSIESTSTDAAGNQQELVGIRLSGANSQLGQTTKSLVVSNAHTGSGSENYAVDITASGASSANYGVRVTATGTASNNYGLFVSASGGTNNYSLITAAGNVGIGTSTPSELLSVGASGSTKGVISLAGNTSGKVIIQPAAAAGTYTLTLPTTDGASGEFLQTDGSGVLTWAAASGGSPAGNFGNLQINRNGAFATPASDSLDWESATGLTVTGGTRTTTLGVNKAAPTATYAAEIASDGTYTTNLKLSNTGTPTSFFTLNSVYGDVLSVGSLFKGSEFLISQSDGIFGISQGANQIARFTANDGMYAGRRWQTKQGADVASAAGAITLGGDGNVFEITGTSAITAINNTNWQNGATITLLFTSTASLTHGTANSGTSIGFELSGAANFNGTAGDVVVLVLGEIGGTQRWRMVSNSVN